MSLRTLRYIELGSAHWYARRAFTHPLLRLLINCTALLRHGCQLADSRCSYRSTKVSRYQQLSGRRHPPPNSVQVFFDDPLAVTKALHIGTGTSPLAEKCALARAPRFCQWHAGVVKRERAGDKLCA